MAPFRGTIYDLTADRCVYEAKGILVSVANQDTIEGTSKVMMEALGL